MRDPWFAARDRKVVHPAPRWKVLRSQLRHQGLLLWLLRRLR